MIKRIYLLAALALTLASCGGKKEADNQPDNGYDRKAMLANLADNIIKPSYNNFKVKFDAMKAQSALFLAAPTTTGLQQFRAAWKEAYVEWQKVEMFDVGPAETVTLRNHFNIYPFSISKAEANMTAGGYNFDEAGQIAVQGFPALDYFLYGSGTNETEVVSYFTDDSQGASRRKYVEDVVAKMDEKLNRVVKDWNGPYRDTFVNTSGIDASSSTSKLVNAYILYFERFLRSGKIGIPAGVMGSSLITPSPEKVEAFYAKNISKELAQTAVQAVTDFYRGKYANSTTTGPSFKTYFAALGTKNNTGELQANVLDGQFEAALNKLPPLNSNFYEQIQTDKMPMVTLFDELQLAVRMLKLDMTSAMGISITYTDNDGD